MLRQTDRAGESSGGKAVLQKRERWRVAGKKKEKKKNSTGEPHKEGKKGGDRREKKGGRGGTQSRSDSV